MRVTGAENKTNMSDTISLLLPKQMEKSYMERL